MTKAIDWDAVKERAHRELSGSAYVVAAVLSLTVLLSIFPLLGLLWKATH